MSFSGHAADRWGSGVVIAGSVSMIGVALIGTALAPTYVSLFPFFLLFYSATAAYEVGINAAAIHYEQVSGRRVIGYFHAAFSGFAALSALIVGSLLAFDVPIRLLYLVPAGLAISFGPVMWWRRTQTPGNGTLPGLPVEEESPNLYRTPIVLLLAAIAALAFLTEGEMGNWVTIYLRSALELPILITSFAI